MLLKAIALAKIDEKYLHIVFHKQKCGQTKKHSFDIQVDLTTGWKFQVDSSWSIYGSLEIPNSKLECSIGQFRCFKMQK